ncbi:ribose transport, ATP-binding protein RbsA [Veillonella parvula ACS-068-V-Sch12]|uniref:sugar ABC transporter ATP-binding protein n=1 Tax=Veillonella parvula TaxID=29466 RepID=UPI00020F0A55|nr:sugar ABC transporter ATP-binding protein [Veillonella parvula]EGL77483.1 ribose transport, ATP-binding protein RbsA [Veillonella parvula ACS-068-V-Sch12]
MEIVMSGIAKAFGTNQVLRDVSITLKEGEVHALMGENGAGKSTLMNILTGIHKADAGRITIDGVERTFPNPREAELNGVAFIHQELNIWPNLTLLENLYLMRPKRNKFDMLDKKAMLTEAENTCRELGIELPLTTEACLCSVGHQQMTEILRILMLDAKVVIMDEPTAALTERETATLFKMMRKMKARGVAIVYISHRMEEVFSECDTITVMRDGHTIITKPTAEISVDEVVRHMVGRSIDEFYPARTTTPGEVVMSVDNLKPEGFGNEISFSLRKGEILGVAGLMGAGRTEIMRAIFGVDKHKGGTVTVNGSILNCKKPEDSIKAGIAFITENRKSEGLILDFSIGSNITLPNLGDICPSHVLDKGKLNSFADELSKKLGVKTQSIHEPASSLSGGNQQKVVIAKWVGKKPSIIIMDEPTRGIDIGAKRDIYDLMNELTNDGVSIIMVSSELPEVLGMSDRVMVIHEGRVAGILDRCDATPESIMTLATGGQ